MGIDRRWTRIDLPGVKRASKAPDERANPAEHPIAVVAQRTGLTQDVLRIWERRYDAVRPKRGDGGERLYSDADVERLRLLRAATRAGRPIRSVARLPARKLAQLVREDGDARALAASAPERDADALGDATQVVEEALRAARELASVRLHDTVRRAAALMGTPSFLERVAAPLMRRVGDEWHAGRISAAQEHLVSAIVHDVVAEGMRELAPGANAPTIVVGTLAGEPHAIGALLVGAAAAAEGWNVVYLGANLPAAEIASAASAVHARLVAVSMVLVDDRERIVRETGDLRAKLDRDAALLVGGEGAIAMRRELARMDVEVVASLAELRDVLRRPDTTG